MAVPDEVHGGHLLLSVIATDFSSLCLGKLDPVLE
jgi:hypothetical protein